MYGLGVDPGQPEAVRALFELKGRPSDKPIGLLAASLEDLRPLVDINQPAIELADEFWPGPLTLVVASAVPLPDWVGDHARHTVAVRVPDHATARRLFASTGPLAVTSANRSGEPPANDDGEARAIFGEAVAVYLPGASRRGAASTVVDVTVDPPRVVREGPAVIDE